MAPHERSLLQFTTYCRTAVFLYLLRRRSEAG